MRGTNHLAHPRASGDRGGSQIRGVPVDCRKRAPRRPDQAGGHGAANPATPWPADGPNDGPIRAVVREGLERAFCERPGIPSTA